MARENYQARLEAVDARRVDDFKEEQNIETKAEATRRLLRRGLRDYESEQEQEEDDGRDRVPEGARRHGLNPLFAKYVRRAVGLTLAIFVGGFAWELGGAFGDSLTLLGGF